MRLDFRILWVDDVLENVEEDIDEVKWMTPKEVTHALHNSYRSIRFVFEVYYKSRKKPKVKG